MECVVGERLRFFRLLNSMNREQLATRLGVTAQHVGLIERGRGYPSVEFLVKAAEALGTEVANFFLSPGSGSKNLVADTEARSTALSLCGADVQLVVGVGTWDFNFATGRETWSEALRCLFGFPDLKTSLREVLLERLAPEFVRRCKAFFNKILEHGRPHPFPCVVISENGTERRLLIHAEQITDGCHGMDRARLIIQDVTDWELYHDLLHRDLNRLEAAVTVRDLSLRQAAEEARSARALSAAAQRELRLKDEQVERLVNAAPAILYSFVPGVGGTEVWSPHTQHILGYTARELLSDPMLWNRSIHPGDAARVDEAIALGMRGQPIDLEYRIRSKDGTWHWLHDQARLVADEAGNPAFIGVAMDISDRKRLEQALSESEKRYRLVTEAVSDFVYTLDIHQDRQPTLAWVSNDQGRFTGFTARDIEASGGPLSIVHPEDMPMVQQTLAGLQSGDQASTEFRIVRKDGEVRWIHTASFPVLDPRLGRVTQIHGAARDVTERRLRDEALNTTREGQLQQGEERYRALFENSSEGVFLHDLEGRILDANQAAQDIFGYDLDELRGLHPLQLVHTGERDHVAGLFQEILLGKTTTGIHRCRRKDGSDFLALVRGKLLGDNLIQGMLRDVSEEERRKQELIQAKKAAEALVRAKSEFLGNMSHELRTPLNGILGMMHVLKSTRLDEEQQHVLSLALKSSNRLSQLLTDLLEMVMLETKPLAVTREAFPVWELCACLNDVFSPTAHEKALVLECVVDPSVPPMLLGEVRRIRQILFQLTGNGLKFTEKGGVRLEMTRLTSPRPEECRVLFTVADTGIGIPEEKLNDIFKPFTQADGSLARPYEGAGLGLAIVKRLVTLMRGVIAVDDTPGGGTTFHVVLPLGLPGDA